MRIVTIGHLAKADISCKISSSFHLPQRKSEKMSKFLLSWYLDSLIPEYIWSQIEPGTAIICACIITYRPLFTTSMFESLASKVRRTSSGVKEMSRDGPDSTTSGAMSEQEMVWPIARDCFGRDIKPNHTLYSKAGNGELHVISVGEAPQDLEKNHHGRDGTANHGGIKVINSFEATRV